MLRNWDILNREPVPDLGTKYDPNTYYGGPLPINAPGEPCGSADQWAGGCSYAVFLAGGYSCDCPEPMMPVYVSSVTCPDGSLTVAPTTGAVTVILNVGHSNHWTATQFFKPPSTVSQAVVVQHLAGQVRSPWEWWSDLGAVLADFTVPAGTNRAPHFLLHTPDGHVSVDLNGEVFALNDWRFGSGMSIQPTFQVVMTGFQWQFKSAGKATQFQGRVACGMNVGAGWLGAQDADLYIDTRGTTDTFAVEIVGRIGGVDSDIFQLYPDGRLRLFYQLGVGPRNLAGNYSGYFDQPNFSPGVIVRVAAFPGAFNPFEIMASGGGGVLFALDGGGNVLTANTAPAAVLGVVIRRLPIYDALGVLLGYLPIYDTIT